MPNIDINMERITAQGAGLEEGYEDMPQSKDEPAFNAEVDDKTTAEVDVSNNERPCRANPGRRAINEKFMWNFFKISIKMPFGMVTENACGA